jgi:hypothetical protein
MVEGFIQGCSMSTYDMPLILEVFISRVHYVLQSVQLPVKSFLFADDIAMATRTLLDGQTNRFHAAKVVLQLGLEGEDLVGTRFALPKLQALTDRPVLDEQDKAEVGEDISRHLRKIYTCRKYLGVWVSTDPEEQIVLLYQEQETKAGARCKSLVPFGRFQCHFFWRSKIAPLHSWIWQLAPFPTSVDKAFRNRKRFYLQCRGAQAAPLDQVEEPWVLDAPIGTGHEADIGLSARARNSTLHSEHEHTWWRSEFLQWSREEKEGTFLYHWQQARDIAQQRIGLPWGGSPGRGHV